MRPTHPPALATWLLKYFGCGPNNAALLGDLDERFSQGRARGWYWKQVFSSVVCSFCRELWSHKLLAVLSLVMGRAPLLAGFAFYSSFFMPYGLWGRGDGILLVVFAFLASMTSGAAVAQVARRNYRSMVLLFIAFQLSQIPFFIRAGVNIHNYWIPAEAAVVSQFLQRLGIVNVAAAIMASVTLDVIGVLIGSGFFSKRRPLVIDLPRDPHPG